MRRSDLAKQVISTRSEHARRTLLSENHRLADDKLADEIRKACYASWTVKPILAQRAAAAIRTLERMNKTAAIRATAFWVVGISEITKGKFEAAILSLDNASEIFRTVGRIADSAQTNVAKLLALAMLGHYDEAIRTGDMALAVFVEAGDDLAAGKIELNLSNIMSRQALHAKSEQYCLSARQRFVKIGEDSWRAMAENGLAITYTELNEFGKAERFYKSALASARSENMFVTEAEIEASLGNLALIRGRYSDALRYLEMSRQKYADLGMPHQSAVADLEIADIYLELNLLIEAIEIYKRVSATFRRLKQRREEARARLNFGRVRAMLGDPRGATRELKRALRLFELENNRSGLALSVLAQAKLEIEQRQYKTARLTLKKATAVVNKDNNARHLVNLHLLKGQMFRATGNYSNAEKSFLLASQIAGRHQQTDSLQLALNSLGELSAAAGKKAKARSYFSKAIGLIEGLRSPLASDDFNTAFLSTRLAPFENLSIAYLEEGRIADAFNTIERGRSRSLLGFLGSGGTRSGVPIKLTRHQTELRAELNFYYKKLDRSNGEGIEHLKNDIRRAEANLTKVVHQINSLSAGSGLNREWGSGAFSLRVLQNRLGESRTLVEFLESNGKISAFVITSKTIRFYEGLGEMAEISFLLEDLKFQFGSLRYGADQMNRFMDDITKRTDQCLKRLFDLLLRPFAEQLSGNHLVIVPTGSLHYVPFNALHDGSGYVVKRYETSSAPSAAVWMKLRNRPRKTIRRSLLIGYADERIPLVENEVRAIKRIVPQATCLTGNRATFGGFVSQMPESDLIHFACHGRFRPDNPMFSSLHLADGWITVQDICSRSIPASLVTLSACETGLSRIIAGDEILGLARGFLTAGASSLIVSLWAVNDAATARLMKNLYLHLQLGGSVAASLRHSQLESINRGEHPFLWSPFILIGV
jgi:tetratricopeptide (TPR) repeat protein